jgi:hypothetical protein
LAGADPKEMDAQEEAAKAAMEQVEEVEPTPHKAKARELARAEAPLVAKAARGEAEAPQIPEAETIEAGSPRTTEARWQRPEPLRPPRPGWRRME